MKRLFIILALCLPLAGCETVENDDGTRTTRFDAKAATDAAKLGFDTYDRYRAYQQPQPYIYNGQVVYPVTQ